MNNPPVLRTRRKSNLALFFLCFLAFSVLLSLLIIGPARASTHEDTGYVQDVRAIEAGSLDVSKPVGLVYAPEVSQFFLLEEGTLSGFDMFENPTGTIPLGVPEQQLSHVTYDPLNMRLVGLDTTGTRLTLVGLFGDGLTVHLAQVQTGVRASGGMAVDDSGRLYLLDREGPALVQLVPAGQSPGSAGRAVSYQVSGRIRISGLAGLDVIGLASEPGSGALYLFSRTDQTLYSVSVDGTVLKSWPLSFLGLQDAAGMAFAPTGDSTDDPANTGLYVLDAGRGLVHELDLSQVVAEQFPEMLQTPTLVATIDTSNANWDPSSPDPVGIDYHPATGQLIISDSEIEEDLGNPPPPYYQGFNVFLSTTAGVQTGNCDTTTFSTEPVGVAVNPDNGHLFFSDDNANEVFEIDFGPDGQYCTGDDVRTSFDTLVFGSGDPEGVAYGNGKIAIADGVNREIYIVSPGANGIFDGIPPAGDDTVTNFDMFVHGFNDPEGIDYMEDTGNWLVVNRNNNRLGEVTTAGALVRLWNISFLSAVAPAGVSAAPGSVNPAETTFYISQRGVDNNTVPDENDGIVFEVSVGLLAQHPSPITDLGIAKSGTDAVLSWSDVVTNTNNVPLTIRNYHVYRDTDPDVDLTTPLASLPATIYTDTGVLDDGVQYYYAVLAEDTRGLVSAVSNRVGVFPITVYQGWNQLSWPMLPPDATLDEVLGDQFYGTADPQTADRVLVWDAATQSYESAWFCGGPICEGWGEPFANHWLANDFSQSTLTLEPDRAFWFQNRSGTDESLAFVGRVFESNRSIDIIPGWNMVGISFLDPRLLDTAGVPATGTDSPTTADRILYWDPTTQSYQTAWYCGGPICESWGPAFADHWLANDFSISTIILQPGHGFWYQNRHTQQTWNVVP